MGNRAQAGLDHQPHEAEWAAPGKAKRPAAKAVQESEEAAEAQFGLDKPNVIERLHKAHDDLNLGNCIVQSVIQRLEGQEIAFGRATGAYSRGA